MTFAKHHIDNRGQNKEQWFQITSGEVKAKCQVELDMMPDAFDDQYIGCEREMDGIAPGLLEIEKSNSSQFRTAWENSEEQWQNVKTKISLPPGFKDEYGRAIITYSDNDFHAELNWAVRKNGKSRADYMDNFHLKAFHYYLTRALQLLKGNCAVMYSKTVYRGTTVSHTGSGTVRFGFFASSSFDRDVAEQFGKATVFTIHTCFGIDIRNFSHIPEEEEVLIPVHEKFNIVFKGQESNSFILRSTNRTCSYFNCAYLGGEYWAEQEKHLSFLKTQHQRELRRETAKGKGASFSPGPLRSRQEGTVGLPSPQDPCSSCSAAAQQLLQPAAGVWVLGRRKPRAPS
uniref:NAD(P)(+)--arginine ADP-ribosyltransferase n=1 Tax=Pelusios castaneus TaxID=367368 RepID=A0A8C8SBX0_9SAUR